MTDGRPDQEDAGRLGGLVLLGEQGRAGEAALQVRVRVRVRVRVKVKVRVGVRVKVRVRVS